MTQQRIMTSQLLFATWKEDLRLSIVAPAITEVFSHKEPSPTDLRENTLPSPFFLSESSTLSILTDATRNMNASIQERPKRHEGYTS
ncbi:uncharacterized protein RCO7_14211 [Rhynchosporium graminicola]|uniref:Uncharacterized protein n=1 Tax=Rhynchosporium graminicola TaxID=2792576 RepID=A0A1E1JZP5_9HELO|nr:uncharacterized protein RCO7_14211 [Rhynchosporium commune]